MAFLSHRHRLAGFGGSQFPQGAFAPRVHQERPATVSLHDGTDVFMPGFPASPLHLESFWSLLPSRRGRFAMTDSLAREKFAAENAAREHVHKAVLEGFSLVPYLGMVDETLAGHGIKSVSTAQPRRFNVERAVVRVKKHQASAHLGIDEKLLADLSDRDLLKVNIEVAMNSPQSGCSMFMSLLDDHEIHARVYDLSTLFAGKIAAIILRGATA